MHFTSPQISQRLSKLGFVADLERGDPLERFVGQTVAYQRFHGLRPDGWAGPVTQGHLFTRRICGCADVLPMAQGLCRWPEERYPVRVAVLGVVNGVSVQQMNDIAYDGLRNWQSVCGIQLELVEAGDPSADVHVLARRIDRRGGILAEAELSCGVGAGQKRRQWYDTADVWYTGRDEPPPLSISLPAVLLHETGHTLGWGHNPTPGQVMSATYSGAMLTLGEWEIREAQNRYGPPQTPPPDPGDGSVVEIALPDGVRVTIDAPARPKITVDGEVVS